MLGIRGGGRTLADLRDGARDALATYTDPRGHYAFRTYDHRGDPDAPLSAADVLLANLLSLRLGWPEVVPLFTEGSADQNAHELRAALDVALARLRDAAPFEEHDSEEALESTLAPLVNANRATESVDGWTAVTVSKVLHRRLPHIVPILDSRVRAFYGLRSPQRVRSALWRDITANLNWLHEEAARQRTPDERPLSVLRCADILIWTAG